VTGRRRWGWVRPYRLSEQELAERGLKAAEQLGRDDPLWPGQLALLVAVLLFFVLPPKLTIGPNWPLPVAETLVLLALFTTGRRGRVVKRRREIALGLMLVAAAANLTALGLLAHYLLVGGEARGADLIGGGAVIWLTNLLLFAVMYWELDRGGPLRPAHTRVPVAPDFLFPQMTADRWTRPGWKPGFFDYLYVSLTNQTAFSPTDTMPLTLRVKVLMSIQGVASFITTGIIVARAVNILD
jgi:uncharacterized membrane protein